MFNRTKFATSLAGLVSMFLIAGGSLGVVPASAADALACTVQGGVTVASPGISNGGGATSGTFNSTTLDCVGVGAGAGTWSVNASFSSSAETCLLNAAGSGSFTSGSGPAGTVTGGSFTFTRALLHVVVKGSIITSSGTFQFAAELIFVPGNGVCSNPTLTNGTTSASIAAGSTAIVTN